MEPVYSPLNYRQLNALQLPSASFVRKDSREMLCLLLRSSRIEVKAVSTAAQALIIHSNGPFRSVLLDAWLPDLDGFELCRRIRRRLPHTPILFYSGAAYETDKQRAIEAGANTYAIKPDLSGLFESITNFIPQTQSAVA